MIAAQDITSKPLPSRFKNRFLVLVLVCMFTVGVFVTAWIFYVADYYDSYEVRRGEFIITVLERGGRFRCMRSMKPNGHVNGYFELLAAQPPTLVFASEAPSYVINADGIVVDWTLDRWDDPQYLKRWNLPNIVENCQLDDAASIQELLRSMSKFQDGP